MTQKPVIKFSPEEIRQLYWDKEYTVAELSK
jgi:hypothetical protein